MLKLNFARGGTKMSNPVMMDVNPDEAAKIEAAIDGCIAAMRLANAKMAVDQVEIERIKAETRAMLSELKARTMLGATNSITSEAS